MSEFWAEFCRIMGIRRTLSTTRHPQTDGQTENANQFIAQWLRHYVSYLQDDWSEWLPIINLAAASLPSVATGKSPFFVERGYELRMSFDWADSTRTTTLEGARQANEL